jgi:hypothetical protein
VANLWWLKDGDHFSLPCGCRGVITDEHKFPDPEIRLTSCCGVHALPPFWAPGVVTVLEGNREATSEPFLSIVQNSFEK